MSRSMVVIELADHAPFARDLSAGGVFVPECALRLAEECDLVVCGVTHQMMIPARVVYVDPRGAGLELLGFSPEMKAQIAELANAMPVEPAEESPLATATASGAAIDDEDLHSGFTEPVPLTDEAELDDDLEIPSLFGRAPTGAPEPVEPADEPHAEEDLAIPVSDEADYVVTEAPIDPAASSEAVFSYGRRGLMVRGGVAHRSDDPADAADDRPPDGDAPSAPDDGTVDPDGSRMLGAELEAELGLADLADHAAAPDDDASLELDLIDPMMGLDEIPRAEPDESNDDEYEDDPDAPEATPDAPRRRRRKFALNVHERLRGLTLAQQIKVAAKGELAERIVLERLYGKNVWEALLRNPRLTAPEVARIARMGSLPRVLLEILVANNAWLQIPEVRRALLSNPRLAADQIVKVLRLTPKHELKLAAIQTAYPFAVRNAAKMLLGGD